MRKDKIQTGLRIPQDRYNELLEIADQSGTSFEGLCWLAVGALVALVLVVLIISL